MPLIDRPSLKVSFDSVNSAPQSQKAALCGSGTDRRSKFGKSRFRVSMGEGFSYSHRVHRLSAAYVDGRGGRNSAIRCLAVLFVSDNDVWRRARFRHRVTSPRRRRVAEHPKCKVGPRDRSMCEIVQCFAVYSSPQCT